MPQSRCLPIAGRPITNHAKNTPLRVGVYGHFLKIVTVAKYDGIRQLRDSIVNFLWRVSGSTAFGALNHDGGACGCREGSEVPGVALVQQLAPEVGL